MNLDLNNSEELKASSPLAELAKVSDLLNDQELNKSLDKMSFNGSAANVGYYTFHKLSQMSIVREKIDECKISFLDSIKAVGTKIDDFHASVKEDVCDFFKGTYENVKDFFADKSDTQVLKSLGEDFYETREFGLDKCSEAAKEIFNPGVIDNWMNFSLTERQGISKAYAAEVAEAFKLEKYSGVIFEDLEPGVLGYNNGDGSIHITNDMLINYGSPLEIVNTITHELRHQYQNECINGYHNVPDEVKNEWTAATAIYDSNSQPWAFDPWGYKYNPLEIDSRYAGETVVRNITKDFINEQFA